MGVCLKLLEIYDIPTRMIRKRAEEVSLKLDDDLNLEEWLKFMKDVVIQLQNLLTDDGVAIFVIGDVAKSKTSVIPLAREFILMIRELKLFKHCWCINDNIGDAEKTTRIWADTKGKATATDRIVILSDINPFNKFKDNDSVEKYDIKTVNKMTKFFVG